MNWQLFKVSIRTSLCVRLLKLNKEGGDSRFIFALNLSDLSIVRMFHCNFRSGWSGGTADLRACGERRQGRGRRGRGGEWGGHRVWTVGPFPIEKAIGWSGRHV